MFGALDLRTGQLYYRIRDRKRWTEFLDFLKSLRRRWPAQKLYLIVDNIRFTSVARCGTGARPMMWNWCLRRPIHPG